MNRGSIRVAKLKPWALAALPILLFALGPQLILWYDIGSRWRGQYATFHGDEYLYSAYLNELTEGRPRRNDPFTGRPDAHKPSLPETAFSIQFVPPLTLAAIAKVFRTSASTMMIVLATFSALSASASVYWLLSSITQNDRVSAIGTLFVLIVGTLAGGQGLIGVLLKLDIVSLGLPFLRRYQPALAFGLFFVFCTLSWRGINAATARKRLSYSASAGCVLIALTFSYLYLWTAAVAWLVCLLLLWGICRRNVDAGRILQVAAITFGILGVGLIPYWRLLSQRSSTLDELQTVISTHRPDLLRVPEIIGVVLLIVLVAAIQRGRIKRDDPRTILGASFCLLSFVVFNQQVLTGKSMQPFHFEVFILNYVVLVGLVIAVTLLGWTSLKSVLPWVTAVCLLLGTVEVALVAGGFHRTDVIKDQMVPVAQRLKELSASEQKSGATPLVFSPQIEFNQILPTYAPQGTLLGMGAVDFGSATNEERKEFLFTHLYFSGATPDHLREIMNGLPDQLQLSYYVKYVIFGHERVRPVFSLSFQPITANEIEKEILNYGVFVQSFSRDMAQKHLLSYAVTTTQSNFDFSSLDRWYQRISAEHVNDSVLYRLQLR